MTIATVRSGIATLQKAIPGIVTAYTQLPQGVINSADLPLFITFARECENDSEVIGSDTILSTRSYLMWLLVKPVAEGEEGEGGIS